MTDCEPVDVAYISPADADAKGITDGETISLKSRSGEVLVKAYINDEVPQGQVWMEDFPFSNNCINCSYQSVYDQIVHTEEVNACAARIDKLK